mgnify:CR=1 FL=1
MTMEFLELAYETYQSAPGILKQNPVVGTYTNYIEVENYFALTITPDGPEKDSVVFAVAGTLFMSTLGPLFVALGCGFIYQNYF